MSSTIKIPAMPKPATTGLGDEYEAFDRDGKSMGLAYENVQYFSADQLAARDAQWQEMVGAILKELKDAATSLETIGRLAGVAEYVGDDGERIPTYMGRGDQIRGYAASRAAVARSALSAITEE